MIREAVRNYFQKEPKTDVDPDQVVAMGAAIHAASLMSSDQEAFLLDVTPLSLRIGVAGDMAESVIERNTPVPIEQTRTFTTFQDNQESVQIRVYQGESRVADENELLGQFEFSGFRKARRGEVAIDVTFEINADGIVNVTARDQETGKQSSTSITLSSGLSENELKSIIDEARTDRVQKTAAAPAAAAVPALPPAPARSERRAASPPAARTAPGPAPVARTAPAPAPAPAPKAAPTRAAAPAPAPQPAPVRSAPKVSPTPRPAPAPTPAPQKTARPDPDLEVTKPQLEPPRAPVQHTPAAAPAEEPRAFENAMQRDSDLAPDPIDDSLDLLNDDDRGDLTPELDLLDSSSAPADGEAATAGLFETPGTDLSTLPDPDEDEKS
jgi:hypothetical protein